MKKLILAIALVFCLTVPLYGESVTLNWGASTSSDVRYYNIYQSTISGSYTVAKRIGQVGDNVYAYTISNVPITSNLYWLITAVDYDGNESVGYELTSSTYRKCTITYGRIFLIMKYPYSKSKISVK